MISYVYVYLLLVLFLFLLLFSRLLFIALGYWKDRCDKAEEQAVRAGYWKDRCETEEARVAELKAMVDMYTAHVFGGK